MEEAFEATWADLADACGLPVDVVWTAYPDRDAMVRASFRFEGAAKQTLGAVAKARGRSEAAVAGEVLVEALRRADADRAARVDEALAGLLAEAGTEEVLKAVARVVADG